MTDVGGGMPVATRLRIAAQTAYPPRAPSPRVRIDNWRPFIRSHGIELRYEPALSDAEYAVLTSTRSPSRKLLTLGRAAVRLALKTQTDGVVLVHRLRFPAPLPAIDRRRLDVYDFDDAVFLGSTMAANRNFAWVKREAERSVAYMRAARLVIAGNSHLAAHAVGWSRRVEVVPSCVDTARVAPRDHTDAAVLTVGWLGSASTSEYLWAFMPVWTRFRTGHHKDARLLLVGADPSLRGPGVEHRTWSLEAELVALREIDIGVMPLPDNPWTRGKCGYKLLQYFSAGVPAIAAPVGMNANLLSSGAGLSATSPGEWLSRLRELASGSATRAEMGRAGRSLVEREYSYSTWAPRLAELLASL
jgi:glycosyltransferase involved in cell wall biosynthesis